MLGLPEKQLKVYLDHEGLRLHDVERLNFGQFRSKYLVDDSIGSLREKDLDEIADALQKLSPSSKDSSTCCWRNSRAWLAQTARTCCCSSPCGSFFRATAPGSQSGRSCCFALSTSHTSASSGPRSTTCGYAPAMQRQRSWES